MSPVCDNDNFHLKGFFSQNIYTPKGDISRGQGNGHQANQLKASETMGEKEKQHLCWLEHCCLH